MRAGTRLHEDRRSLRRISGLLQEYANRLESGGLPGSAECVRLVAETDVLRLKVRCSQADQMRREFDHITNAATEPVRRTD